MCGRFALSDTQTLALRFEVAPGDETALIPRYNVAPSQMIPVIVEEAQGRVLRLMRWGFRPAWKKAGGAPDPINARAESLTERPMFRSAIARKRCLIPADGFYEWRSLSPKGAKQPYFIHLKNDALFAFAGLYSEARDAEGSPLSTCAIVTTTANEVMAGIHDRMPTILEPDDEEAWLDPELVEAPAAAALLRPYRSEEMEAFPVSTRVSSPRNEGPDLIERQTT